MPFNKDTVLELRIKERISQKELAEELESLARKQGNHKFSMDPSYVSLLENGKKTNPTIYLLDLLHLYARTRSHEDLNFYLRPSQE